MNTSERNEFSTRAAVGSGFDEPPAAAGPPHPDVRVSTEVRAGTGRRVAVGAVLLAVGLGAVFAFRHATQKKATVDLGAAAVEAADAPPAVEVVRVRRAAANTVLVLPGEARAFYETTLYARTSGYLSKWCVDIGDRVKQGQTLATIETPELDDQLAAAEAKVNQARSEVDLARAAAGFAKLSYGRFESAAPEGVVSAQDRDQKKAELESADARLAAADAQVKLAAAQAQGFKTLAAFKNVTAPFDGTITQRHVDIGDLVTAGSTSSTSPLFSVAKSDQIRVFVNVPQGVSRQIKVGMPAEVAAAEYPGRPFAGRVERTADSIDPVSRTLKVEVLVPNPDLELKPGMYVQASFKTDRQHPPLEVPAAAVTMRPSGAMVAVVSADKKVHLKSVTIAQDLGEVVELVDGVSAGDAVALNLGGDVADGEAIDVHEAEGGKPQAAAAPTPAAPRTADSHGPTTAHHAAG